MGPLSWRTFNKNNHSCTASAGIWSKLPFYPHHLRFLQRAQASAKNHLEQSGVLKGRKRQIQVMHHLDNVSGLTSGCRNLRYLINLYGSNQMSGVFLSSQKVPKVHTGFSETNKSGVWFTQHVRTLHVRPHTGCSQQRFQFNIKQCDYAHNSAKFASFHTGIF